jgi:TonB family protein
MTCVLTMAVLTAVQGDVGAPWTSMIPAQGLAGWTAQRATSACVENVASTLTVYNCAGWLRTEKRVNGDFAMAFEVRARSVGARALLGLMGISDRNGRPEVVLGVTLLGPEDSEHPSTPRVERLRLSETARTDAMRADGEWQSFAITRNRLGVHVLLNGTQILSSGPVHASDGWIGFTADSGSFELRNLRSRYVAPPSVAGRGTAPVPGTATIGGAYRTGGGVSLPKLVHEVRPNYTAQALAARIEGAVLIECVVKTDGTVGEATVIRSLDDRLGLDEEALKAARGWRFQPGTRDGVPVPVLITIELTFIVKK